MLHPFIFKYDSKVLDSNGMALQQVESSNVLHNVSLVVQSLQLIHKAQVTKGYVSHRSNLAVDASRLQGTSKKISVLSGTLTDFNPTTMVIAIV